MPFDGAGNYTPSPAPNFPAVSGAVINSTYYNNVINDLATAMSMCLTRDGQGKPSANIDWNAKNLTNVAVLAVTGNATVGGTLGITGALTLTAGLVVGTTLAVTGAATIGGTLAVTGTITAPDDAYAVGWNGALTVPTKNALYDKIETLAKLASPTFTGTPAGPTAAVDTNTTQLATTAYVIGQGYAKLANPAFTGVPTVPTAAVDTNTTQAASTAYVVAQGYAKLASPTFIGTPAAPTAAWGTNTTQLATTAFVDRLRGIPSSSSGAQTLDANDRGTCVKATGTQTVPANVFAADDVVTIYANSASAIALTQGSSLTMRAAGTSTTGSLTLAARGFATIFFISATECVVSGNIS